ncbi:hypothetical protein R1flu_015864 [Riccia fluitans]|uniref:DUF676 domain-containing protein n=1 Tax=Riccia fluitans TaxID=41844 RepID=A0ABD1YKN9_9MARC
MRDRTMHPTTEQQAEKFRNRKRKSAEYTAVYELLEEPNPDIELVFFHGLQMEGSAPEHSFWRTWKLRGSEDCWPEALLPEMLHGRRFNQDYQIKARVLAVSYEGRPDLDGDELGDDCLIADSLVYNLILDNELKVGQRKGVPVFLLGHDLGGILIKRFVMMLESQVLGTIDEEEREKIRSFLKNLKSVFFFATPHSGSPAIEAMASRIDDSTTNEMLHLMKVLNTETGRINAEFQQYRRGETNSKVSRFTSHAVHATNATNEGGFHNVLVVPEGSARYDVDSFYSVSANHFSVCQAEGTYTSSIRFLSERIKSEVWKAQGERGR